MTPDPTSGRAAARPPVDPQDEHQADLLQRLTSEGVEVALGSDGVVEWPDGLHVWTGPLMEKHRAYPAWVYGRGLWEGIGTASTAPEAARLVLRHLGLEP